jgi:cytochrome c2
MRNHFRRFFSKLTIVFWMVGFVSISGFAQQDVAAGKTLFNANCKSCHYFDKASTGPALHDVVDRVPKPSNEWLHKWIKNNVEFRASGDAYANKIYNDYKGAAMTVFGYLSDTEIDNIIAYLNTKPSDPQPVAAGGGKPGAIDAGEGQATETSNSTLYFIFGAITLLVIFIGAFRQMRIALQNEVNRRSGKPEQEDLTFWQEAKKWMGQNRRFLGVCGVVLVLVGMRSCWTSLWYVGIYAQSNKGPYELAEPGAAKDRTYKPEQPIKFSHKLHAGDNEIACQYCHSTVEKSKHAGIPTVNICMNCHKGIQQGPQYGEAEIKKIYAAAGFDPAKMADWNPETAPQNPIKWVKVHNLPDHVSFSHVHHVVVGKQDCANCHGDMKKMTVAEQVSPLTMGWCIDCHRKTEVPGLVADAKTGMPANPYYQQLHAKLSEQYKGQNVKFTVDKIGGLECGKCHY